MRSGDDPETLLESRRMATQRYGTLHSAKPGVIILRGFLKVGLEHLRHTLVGGNKTWAAVEGS